MNTQFNYITGTLYITKAVANECSQIGDNEYSVNYYRNLPKYKKQLTKLDKEQVKKELKEYGAWDDDELENHNDNLQRLFWLSCSNIVEMLYSQY